ncbi:MAG: hypothetical protein QM523_00935 [Candidatus Pacebacteria bacterium]|nr:hypothetical protein [Candidatus Paceibacterota bacterium]
MKYSLTQKQASLLAFIRTYIEMHGGVAPSYDEMVEATNGKNKSNIHRLIAGLIDRGHVAKRKGQARSIVLLGGGE